MRTVKTLSPSHFLEVINSLFKPGHVPTSKKAENCWSQTNLWERRPASQGKLQTNHQSLCCLPTLKYLKKYHTMTLSLLPGRNKFFIWHPAWFFKLETQLQLVKKILKKWEDRNHRMGVFIDLQKAFDCVDWALRYRKLQ